MSNTITVYERPGCQPCMATKRHLDKLGIEYTKVDTSTDAAARDHLVERGFSQSPVVIAVVNGKEYTWSGYRDRDIAALSFVLKEAAA